MNLRKWSKDHTLGLLFGIVTPFLVLPLVIYLWAAYQGYTFDYMWRQFVHFYQPQIKCLTLSIIVNLAWFYRFLNKERYDAAMGVILGSLLFGPYIIYIKFFM